jgi:hypothetical protein
LTFRASVIRAAAIFAAAAAAVPAWTARAVAAPEQQAAHEYGWRGGRPTSEAAATAAALRGREKAGSLTGIVLGALGDPMSGVCVSAQPAAASFRPAGRAAVTTNAGMFTLSGLATGAYDLSYRNCAGPGGIIAWPSRAALSPAARLTPSTPSRAYAFGGQLVRLAPVTVRSAGGTAATATMPARPRVRMLTIAQARRLHLQGSSPSWGGISGTVLGPHHRPLAGICVQIVSSGFIDGVLTGRGGKFETGKNLFPGKYPVEFSPYCTGQAQPTGNWAPQWYRDKYRHAKANLVVVRANKITQHIDATMRRGAVIIGTATGRRGRGVAKVCVVATAPNGTASEGQVATGRDGRYRFEALDPGRVRVGFFPDCGGFRVSAYLAQWWPGKPTEAKSGLIRLRFGSHRSHVDARLVLGGTISGTIRFRNRHGRPLKGICVFVQPANQPFSIGFDAFSLANGFYAVHGLPTGRYSVSFGPGCNDNGNYLYQNYPHDVTVRLSKVTGNINAYMQPGAIITGTVTDKATGKPLSGICVLINNGDGMAETGRDGTYYANQLTPGQVPVEFDNCANRGNYAPQYYPGQLNPAAGGLVSLRGGAVTSRINAAMTPGATISGRLTSPSGDGLRNVCADGVPTGGGLPASSFVVQFGYFAQSSKGGRYAVENLPPGQYQVAFGGCGGPNVADQWFMDQTDPSKAAEINLAAGQHVAQINAVMQSAGVITGTIRGPASQRGTFVCMYVTNASTGIHAFEEPLFPLGVGDSYVIGGLATGSYVVEFQPCGGENLAQQWYNDANSPANARHVHVFAGHFTRGVNASLVTGGSITGRVFGKSTGKPIAHVCVYAQGTSQPFFGFGASDRRGRYRVVGLNTGVYRLFFGGCGPVPLLTVVSGRVRATAGRSVPGPDASLTPFRPGAISGRVRVGPPGPAPLPGVCVSVLPAAGSSYVESAAFGQTGTGGYYQIGGLVPGKYKVKFDPSCVTEAGGQVPQWYSGKPFQSTATIVTVVAGRTIHGISAKLQQDGSITGAVTGVSRQALTGVCVQASPPRDRTPPFLAVSSGPRGSYDLGPLNPGRYLIEFSSGCGAIAYATQWWRHASSIRKATVLIVRAGVTRHGIDATMTRRS